MFSVCLVEDRAAIAECDRTPEALGKCRPRSGVEGHKTEGGVCPAEIVYKSEPFLEFGICKYLRNIKK